MPVPAVRTIVPEDTRNFGRFGDATKVPPLTEVTRLSSAQWCEDGEHKGCSSQKQRLRPARANRDGDIAEGRVASTATRHRAVDWNSVEIAQGCDVRRPKSDDAERPCPAEDIDAGLPNGSLLMLPMLIPGWHKHLARHEAWPFFTRGRGGRLTDSTLFFGVCLFHRRLCAAPSNR